MARRAGVVVKSKDLTPYLLQSATCFKSQVEIFSVWLPPRRFAPPLLFQGSCPAREFILTFRPRLQPHFSSILRRICSKVGCLRSKSFWGATQTI